MSMLAEKKRKQKWSLNPRGNDWVQDSNKFGQKMLEKMGWQHGKGLGAKENGITEHIKVSYKNDSKGMGYKESNDQWTEHESNFSALLESLSSEKPDEIKLNSLEKKSQSSKVRVHYHKFTRGKDLSRYSEKDLANIFGKKSLKEPVKVEIKEEKVDRSAEKEENESKFLFNAGSMRDYFKKKLPGFGKSNGYAIGQNGVLKKEESVSFKPSFSFNSDVKHEEDDEVSYVGFGFKSAGSEQKSDNVKPSFVSYINGNHNEESTEKKTKKKRKAEEKEVENVFSPKKKSRKDISRNVSESNGDKGVSNPAFNPLHTPIKVQKHVLDTIEESVSENEDGCSNYGVTTIEIHASPKKTKKRLSENGFTIADTEESVEITVEKKKNPKKVKSQQNGVVNCVFEENDAKECTIVNADNENEAGTCYEVKRKKKKKKSSNVSEDKENTIDLTTKKSNKEEKGAVNNDIDVVIIDDSKECKTVYENPNFEQNFEEPPPVSQPEENPYEVKVKKSKKKKKEREIIDSTTIDFTEDSGTENAPRKPKIKKNKHKTLAVENPGFDDVSIEDTVDLSQIEENPYEVKVKKKSKGSSESLNLNDLVEDSTNVSQTDENPYEVKVKRKKKKKKTEEYAIENPNFNESLEEITTEIEENPYEVKPKKKKKKNVDSLAVDNPNFDPNDSPREPTIKKEPIDLNETQPVDIVENDLMLNIVTTPIIKKTERVNGENTYSVTKISGVKRRKSVRFSDVTQERIIPSNEDMRDIENRNELFEINTRVINSSLEEQNISFDMSSLDKFSYNLEKGKLGVDNVAFDKQNTNLEENLDTISKTIDRYQAEIENDINEKKLESLSVEDIMVGEVGNPHGEHEKLPEGTKLKFKYANFVSRAPFYQLNQTGAKKSYKHLIKGDIVVGFKNTNLHEIQGYAAKTQKTSV